MMGITGTLAAISAGATIIGGATSAYGAYEGGKANASMYNYQAGVANWMANNAQLNANWDIMSGEQKAYTAGLQERATVGKETVRAGASNIATGAGSTLNVVRSAMQIGQENEAVLRADAAHAAWGEETQASALHAQASADIWAARNAVTSGEITAAGDIFSAVGSAASVGSKWYEQNPAPSVGDTASYTAPTGPAPGGSDYWSTPTSAFNTYGNPFG